jgi:hypothetical protein
MVLSELYPLGLRASCTASCGCGCKRPLFCGVIPLDLSGRICSWPEDIEVIGGASFPAPDMAGASFLRTWEGVKITVVAAAKHLLLVGRN